MVLVERQSEHAFAPSFLWLMIGDRQAEQIRRPIRTLVRPGVELIHDEVTDIDIANRRVTTTAQSLSYDHLIIALGAELAPELIPGLSEGTFSFYTFEGTKQLGQTLGTFRGGNIALVVAAVPYKRPGAPHEAAMLLANFFRKRGVNVRIDLYTPEPQPMPVAGSKLGEAVKQMLASRACYGLWALGLEGEPQTVSKRYPSDVSDEVSFRGVSRVEWVFVAPYLTLMREDAPQRGYALREVFDGLRWIVRAGAAGRMMPEDLPPWEVVYQQTQRWLAAGVFEAIVQDLRVLLRLAEGRAAQPSAVIFDSRTLQSSPESGR